MIAIPTPVNRTQMWVARGAILVLAAFFIFLRVFAVCEVTGVKQGNSLVYTAPPVGPLMAGVLGIIVVVVAAVYCMQRRPFFRLVGIILMGSAGYTLFNAPTGINHRLVVTPDGFYQRTGSWYSPVEVGLEFGSLDYVAVRQKPQAGTGRPEYELSCYPKSGRGPVHIPIYDMMKKALGEILRNAAMHGVTIAEDSNGQQIPPALYH